MITGTHTFEFSTTTIIFCLPLTFIQTTCSYQYFVHVNLRNESMQYEMSKEYTFNFMNRLLLDAFMEEPESCLEPLYYSPSS